MDEIVESALNVKYLAQWLFGAGIMLLAVFGFLWWHVVYENPYNVYWGMLANSLATSSVTKHVTQTSTGTKLDQYIAFNFGADNFAYGHTTLTDATSVVTTESIGTITNDYIRYTNIITTQKGASNKKLDFANVLGKWAKANAANTSSQTGSAPFFIQSLVGIDGGNTVPIANLPANQRQDLLKLLHESTVFDTSFTAVQKKMVHGRQVYIYPVSIEPVAYVAFQKAYAALVGIKSLDNVDPNSYQSDAPIKAQFVIDVRSHRLSSVVYPNTNHSETYGSYGVPVRQALPKATISDIELQQLLTGIQ